LVGSREEGAGRVFDISATAEYHFLGGIIFEKFETFMVFRTSD
jgi:hypothetical protein